MGKGRGRGRECFCDSVYVMFVMGVSLCTITITEPFLVSTVIVWDELVYCVCIFVSTVVVVGN